MDEWFDIYSLTNPSEREELHVEVLRDSINFISKVVRDEAKILDPSRIILLGLSQGAAIGEIQAFRRLIRACRIAFLCRLIMIQKTFTISTVRQDTDLSSDLGICRDMLT